MVEESRFSSHILFTFVPLRFCERSFFSHGGTESTEKKATGMNADEHRWKGRNVEHRTVITQHRTLHDDIIVCNPVKPVEASELVLTGCTG